MHGRTFETKKGVKNEVRPRLPNYVLHLLVVLNDILVFHVLSPLTYL